MLETFELLSATADAPWLVKNAVMKSMPYRRLADGVRMAQGKETRCARVRAVPVRTAAACEERCNTLQRAMVCAARVCAAQCRRTGAGMRHYCVAVSASMPLFDHAAVLHARLPEANSTSMTLTLNARA
ncbi:hypothetical protein KM539_09005 [Xanthomonas translucens pv. poae]|uniref:hypothetical protein n=1 Tax=Xanthomonas graminis TaxID=3390026 RepID=UPI001479FF07|nr:hypothetical protein [Xanthomonas translucens]UKE64166.1 hypothetical protein KM539_09005 [Xanthomonas translucens pv. poae]